MKLIVDKLPISPRGCLFCRREPIPGRPIRIGGKVFMINTCILQGGLECDIDHCVYLMDMETYLAKKEGK